MSGNLVKILDGNTFVVSDDRGDIEASPTDPTGLFSFDTRFLSRWVLTIDGERLNALSTDDIHYFETRFFLVPGTGTVYVDSKLSVIRRRAVGHGFHEELQILNHDEQPVKLKVLVTSTPLMVLAAAAALFHFASAPMLLLVSQKLALASPGREAALTSAAIVTAQLVTIPMGLVIARANTFGRKPLLLTALTALPVRGLILASVDDPALLIAAQVLDGIGGGLFDALLPLVLADITQHTGRYNVSRGFLGTVQGVGGSLSQVVAGSIVVAAGYGSAFLALTVVALVALVLVVVAMPETAPHRV